MKDIRFGIIGCGDVTEKKSGPAFRKVEGSELVMVMRRDAKKLESYAKRHQVDKYTTDYLALLSDPDIDAVYIATPPKWHHFYVMEAAKHKKAIYVEKPMGRSVEECQEMVDICKKYEVPLFVAYYRRGQEKFNRIKTMIEEGDIGEIRSFHFAYTGIAPKYNPERDWLMKKEEAGGGLLYDIGSHMLDMLLFLFGEVKYVSGYSANQTKGFEVQDITTGMLIFEKGVQGSIQFTFNASEEEDELVIVGSEGSIRFSVMSNDPVIVKGKGLEEVIQFDALPHVQQPFIQEIVDALQGKNNMDTTGIAGLKTQKILAALEKEL
jgi:predicted dehydrogenase